MVRQQRHNNRGGGGAARSLAIVGREIDCERGERYRKREKQREMREAQRNCEGERGSCE